MEKKHIVGILVGEEPMCEEAKSMSCPYCVLYASSNNTVFKALQRTSPKTEEGQKFKDGLLNILEKMRQIEDTRPDPD